MSSVTIKKRNLEQLLNGPNGVVEQSLSKVAIRVRLAARAKVPVDTGSLKASIVREIRRDEAVPYARVGSYLKYAIYVEYGTGLFNSYPGGEKGRIYPKTKKVLSWVGPDGRVVVMSIKGMSAQPYLRPALKEVALRKEVVT